MHRDKEVGAHPTTQMRPRSNCNSRSAKALLRYQRNGAADVQSISQHSLRRHPGQFPTQ
jgi:hypothetical protein